MMLEAATLLDDALFEYAEMEALFLETLPAAGGPDMVFGALTPCAFGRTSRLLTGWIRG